MAKAEIKFTAPLRVGDVLTLLSAERPPQAVRVEAIGADWVVMRDRSSQPLFLPVDPETLTDYRDTRGGPLPDDLW
jgi:hypothetical protein